MNARIDLSSCCAVYRIKRGTDERSRTETINQPFAVEPHFSDSCGECRQHHERSHSRLASLGPSPWRRLHLYFDGFADLLSRRALGGCYCRLEPRETADNSLVPFADSHSNE